MGNFGKIHVANNVGLISVTLALNPLIYFDIFLPSSVQGRYTKSRAEKITKYTP